MLRKPSARMAVSVNHRWCFAKFSFIYNSRNLQYKNVILVWRLAIAYALQLPGNCFEILNFVFTLKVFNALKMHCSPYWFYPLPFGSIDLFLCHLNGPNPQSSLFLFNNFHLFNILILFSFHILYIAAASLDESRAWEFADGQKRVTVYYFYVVKRTQSATPFFSPTVSLSALL